MNTQFIGKSSKSGVVAGIAAVAGAVGVVAVLLAGCGGGGGGGGNPVIPGDPDNNDGGGKQQYNLSLSANPDGSANFKVSPSTTVNAGDTITVTVSPDIPGKYTFLEWAGASTSTEPVVKIVMNGNKTLTAKFLEKFSITTTANPVEGGIIDRIPDSLWHSADSMVALKATANPGYKFNGWEGDTLLPAEKISFGYIVTSGGNFVVANFKKMPQVLVTFIVDGVETPAAGSVSIEPEEKPYYEIGDVITLIITPEAGYTFSGWLDSDWDACTGNTPQCTITIGDTDVELTADFWSL